MLAKKILFISLLVSGTFGCTIELRQDVDRLQKSVNELRGYQAEQTTQISNLEAEVRTMQGKFEELEYSQSKKMGTEVDSLKNALSDIKRHVPPPAIVPAATLEDDERFAQTLPEDVASRFAEALQKIREGSFADAVPLLQTTLDLSSGEPQSAQILFWLGVSYEGAGDNRQALLAYNQVVNAYPKSARAPLALLRQSGVMGRIGDSKGAQAILKKLIADHPGSPEAAQARQRLSTSK
jgi:TolA-binding protein